MRYHHPLNYILNNKTKIVCLRFLCHNPGYMNGTQLAKLVGISVPAVHAAMKELFEERVVVMRTIGNNHLYEIDRTKHMVTKVLLPLFAQEHMLVETLKQSICKIVKESAYRQRVVSLALFGSVQEKREHAGSDIDVLVVVHDGVPVHEMESIFFDGTNPIVAGISSPIEPLVKTVSQLSKESGYGVVQSILKSHTLLMGKRLEEVIWSQKTSR